MALYKFDFKLCYVIDRQSQRDRQTERETDRQTGRQRVDERYLVLTEREVSSAVNCAVNKSTQIYIISIHHQHHWSTAAETSVR